MAYCDSLAERPVAVTARYAELVAALDRPLSDDGVDGERVIRELSTDIERGILASSGPRFFGWVCGGTTPTSIAADWLVTVWDQTPGLYQCGPGTAVVEEIAARWLVELLGLPRGVSYGFVTGTQMAHFTALAAARHKLLAARDWDVERRGLRGAPRLRVIVGDRRHDTIDRAVRMLGLGSDAIVSVRCDAGSRIDVAALGDALDADPDCATVVCLQAGELNSGAFDPFADACALAHRHAAWVHVDGAFGLWAAASPTTRHLVAGVDRADSWSTDGHKWLNVPYDSGYVFVADPEPHRAALSASASYFLGADGAGRDPVNWNPEWSRRARGVPTYAAIRAMGRRGIAELVDRCCRLAKRLVTELGDLPGAEVIAPAQINQGLVGFAGTGGECITEAVAERVRARGGAWFGCTTWGKRRAMRVSVSGWRTGDRDIDTTVAAVGEVVGELRAG